MKKEKNIIILIFTISILALFLLYLTINDNRRLTLIEAVIKEPILFVQKITLKPINFVKRQIDNQTLKKEDENKLNNYSLLESELEEKQKRIEELESILDIKTDLSNFEIINASVISRNVGLWYQTLTLDKGESANVLEDCAVATSSGLIGKIIKTTKNTSTVKLLTSASSSFQTAVLIKNEEDDVFGILNEYRDNHYIIRGLSYNKEIKKGSIVTTSGLDNIFPSGLLIGEVDRVEKDNFDLEQIVSVKPISSFDNINYVAILKRTE